MELSIASASVDLADPRACVAASSAEWLDAARHPEIRYELLYLEPRLRSRFRAQGTLTICGRTHPITSSIILELSALGARASGQLTINRRDFGLGVGPTSALAPIGPEIHVMFDLAAQPLSS